MTTPLIHRPWPATYPTASVSVLAASLTLLANQASGACRYSVQDLGTVPGHTSSYTFEQVLSNRGHVAVYANNVEDPNGFADTGSLLWFGPGRVVPLIGLPGSTATVAIGMNDKDEVVGLSGPDGVIGAHAVLWRNGRVHDLGTLPGDPSSQAVMINNAGLIVGLSANDDFSRVTGVVWVNGKARPLPPLPGAVATYALGVNDAQQIVGLSGASFGESRAVLWSRGVPVDLGTLGGATSAAVAVNNRGYIVGISQVPSGDLHACAWFRGRTIDLGTVDGDPYCIALDVNESGQVAGVSAIFPGDPVGHHALVWEHGVPKILQDFIPEDSGWELLAATSINDRGQIAGHGRHQGQVRAFLLTPEGNHH